MYALPLLVVVLLLWSSSRAIKCSQNRFILSFVITKLNFHETNCCRYRFLPDLGMAGEACILRLQYKSTLSAEHFNMKIGRFEIDEGALLTSSGEDRDQDTVLASPGDGRNGAGGKNQCFGMWSSIFGRRTSKQRLRILLHTTILLSTRGRMHWGSCNVLSLSVVQ